ncbi:cysteine desulfurase [Candidatus Uhrbacteria bacterium]|nr:cysteine desulfurase [Candidatus Uhrbacteria bacterium]
MFDIQTVRKDFPILKRQVNGAPLVYLDNAATTQKPRQVIDAITKYYETTNANIHRGIHTLAEEATAQYEDARKKVAAFIGAKDPAEIIFVRNATEGINLVAQSYVRNQCQMSGVKCQVLLSEMEHHSNLVPWQMIKMQNAECRMQNVESRFIPVTPEGTLDLSNLDALLDGVKFVSITHASNVLGTINDIKKIIEAAHRVGAKVLVDAAQSVPHMTVNVEELGCDFLVFSGHKMYGPTGIGVLWGRRELLEVMPPFLGGGDMIRSVRYNGFEPNDLPWKFEAGTPHITGAIGLGAAVDYVQGIGMDAMREHEQELTRYALKKMRALPDITIYGPKEDSDNTSILRSIEVLHQPVVRGPVIAFNLNGVHAHDVATLLDREGIAIRSGHHCAEPLVKKFGQTAMARISFGMYNTKEEIDILVAGLEKVRKVFTITPPNLLLL